jgi:hypothetical protein
MNKRIQKENRKGQQEEKNTWPSKRNNLLDVIPARFCS